jgi:glycosyltransferase XagB
MAGHLGLPPNTSTVKRRELSPKRARVIIEDYKLQLLQAKEAKAELERQNRRRLELSSTALKELQTALENKKRSVDSLLELKVARMDQASIPPAVASAGTEEQVSPAQLRLGDRLILEGVITPEQLNEAISVQKRRGGRIGDILVEHGLVGQQQVDQLSARGKTSKRLGDLLVESGKITPVQLEKALEFQRKSGGMLGDILMALRFIEAETLYRFIATQYGVGRVGTELSLENLKKLPEALARKYDAVVVNQASNRYLVAVGTLLDQDQKKHLEDLLGMPVEQVLATRGELEYFWKSIYTEELMSESTNKLITEQPQNSAHITFTKGQVYTFLILTLILTICLVLNAPRTLIAVNILIQAVYFAMTVFKFSIIMYGTRVHSQLRYTPEELAAIDERELPLYTILVPMYKEARVIPRLLDNLERLDYPKSKLDVRLLIEQDDEEAQELLASMNLPPYYTVIVVPHSMPKTKPKACNYGLIRARGEYVVIYDAEDRPDPDQLKKVYLGFRDSPEHCVCIQAKLNYFNSDQNLLTRWFTQEYSMWFELLLPGVMQLDIPIPLGGTSNHFKMSVLKEINAWDPHNVTEDADLGIRLYKAGYTTAIIDSRTWEEANSQVGNWIRQRSRWIKGYMQTWLVHMRNPVRLWRELGFKGFWGFQVMVFATPMLPLTNPFYWTMLVLWYGWKMGWIEQLFPGAIYYFAAVEFMAGNFLFVFSHVAGVYWVIQDLESKRNYTFSYGLVKYAILTPIYWVLMSMAAVKAAWQLITKPFYWEKTTHGLDHTHTTHDASPPGGLTIGGGL